MKLISVFVSAYAKCWFSHDTAHLYLNPGAVARSVVVTLGMQAVPRSIPVSYTFFHKDLVMKIPLIKEEQLTVKGKRMYA